MSRGGAESASNRLTEARCIQSLHPGVRPPFDFSLRPGAVSPIPHNAVRRGSPPVFDNMSLQKSGWLELSMRIVVSPFQGLGHAATMIK